MKNKIKFIIPFIFVMFLTITNSVKAVEELPDNGAKISSVQVIQTKTGTGPFDDNDEPGNDSSEDNNIVRSFDQVTWTIENTMVVNNTGATSYSGGRIYFEAVLPNDVFTSETASWDLNSMNWVEDINVSSDGLTITGYYSMNTATVTIPGKQSLVFVAKIFGAANNIEFQPIIKTWLNGNTEENYINTIPDKTIVSAAPKYNVVLSRNPSLNRRTTVNYDGTNIAGRIYGYSLLLQLYNSSVEKGLKGIEYPKGDITLDINMSMLRSSVNNSSVSEDITDEALPLLWNYSVNDSSVSKGFPDRVMQWSNYDERHNRVAPSGMYNIDKPEKSIYDSGKIKITQEGSKLHVTMSDYKFNGEFPKKYLDTTENSPNSYTENIGGFICDYFQIIVPDCEALSVPDSNYNLKLIDTNFSATSLTDVKVTNQVVNNDDSSGVTYVKFNLGTYNHFIDFPQSSPGNKELKSIVNRGRGGDVVATPGNLITPCIDISIGGSTDEEFYIYSVNEILKFDADCFEPYSDKIIYSSNGIKFNAYYLTKKDGTNYSSQAEMNNLSTLEDFNVYKNKSDIPEGYEIVGIFFESKEGGHWTPLYNEIHVNLKIKEDTIVNRTYAMTMDTYIWSKDNALDRSIYTVENSEITTNDYPKETWKAVNRNYIKTEYSDNGTIISGTHNGSYFWGNTVLILPATLDVEISTVDENDIKKSNYDISKNEYDVTYKIEPTLSSATDNIKDTGFTISITDTLPFGLTYVPDSSNYGNPEIISNSDGSSRLVWYINNCTIEDVIEPIYFKAHINENTSNGTQFLNEVVIDCEEIKSDLPRNRKSSTGIQVTNLSSHRLYKVDSTPVIEKNGEIHYILSYKNNTDEIVPEFQLLDILPYNGDDRGTDYTGAYVLDRLVVTQEDESGNILSNDNLKLLYTEDESVRENVTSKDENLGETWTKVNTETLKRNATAFVVKGKVGSQGKVTVDVYLKTNNNKGLDKYVNNATAQVYKETEEMVTSNVVSQVVERKIEGIAWEDINANGTKDENEQIFRNIEVTLADAQGQQVTDVNGNIVGSVRTDENGYYKFENLPKENYYVKVSLPNSKYQLTEKGVGSNSEINSKFDIDARETDEITKLNSIDLPELTVSNVNAGFVKKATKVVVNYKEVGTNTLLHEEVTIDGRIDDRYVTEDKLEKINEVYSNKYEYVRVEGMAEGNMTEDTIYVTYWYDKKQSNVKVLHVLEGTDVTNPESVTNVLYPTEEIIDKVDTPYNTKNRLNEINSDSKVQYELVTDEVENKSGSIAVNTIYVIYEYRTIPAKVKVNHLEKETNTVLYDQEILNGLVGNGYTSQNRLEEINNEYANKYELVSEPENKNGTYKKEEQEITYYYQRKMAEVEVNYLEVGTEKVLATQETLQDRVDNRYTTVNKLDEINEANENKYEFVETTGDATEGVYKLEKQVINYYYQKKIAEVEVNYLEVGTDKVLATPETLQDSVDNRYTTVNKLDEINEANENKYEFVETTGDATEGVYKLEKQVINYYYQKKIAEVEVNYLEVGTDKVLATQETLQDSVDNRYTTVNKLDEINEANENKYEFVETTGDATEGAYKLDKQVVNYYYQKKSTNVKVLHVLEGTDVSNPELVTDVLYQTEEITGKVDDSYTTQNRLSEINNSSKEQYDLVTDDVVNKTGNMKLDTVYVVYEYRKAESAIKIEHRDVNTREELLEGVTQSGIVGTSYTTENRLDEINDKNENKYELVTPEPSNKNGEYKREEQVITYYYQKKESNVIVKYVDIETEEELADEEKIIGKVDDIYETKDKVKEINETKANKYVLVKTTENTEGNMILDTIEVVYYYKKVEAQVIVKYVYEKTGENLVDEEYFGGYVGDEYTTSPKEIEGYELVEKRIPENKDGIYDEEIIEVIYYYNKIPEVASIDTGDIAVYVLSVVAVVSIAGIIFVVIKNKKK